MRRFLVDKLEPEEGMIRVHGAEARHMTRVLRMGPGDRIMLMDGSGERLQAVIRSIDGDAVYLEPERPVPSPPPSPVDLTLCTALLKSRAMDYLVQKSSELGVTRIRPFTSGRTVVKLPGERVPARLLHWRDIARNAAKQADRSVPAEVLAPLPFPRLLEDRRGGKAVKVLLWEAEAGRDLKYILRSTGPCPAFDAIIGPEGGFREEEVEKARSAGFLPVSLGRRVLRAETAALTVAAIVQYEWGDLSLPASGA